MTAEGDISDIPLTVRGQSLLDEARYDNGKPKTVGDTLSAFQSYLRSQRSREMRLENGNWSTSNRFVDRYSKSRYGKVAGADRQLQRDFGDLHCVTLTLSAPPKDDNGEYRPPADYLSDLLSSKQSVSDAISYKLRESIGVKFAQHWILSPNRDCRVSLRNGLWVNGTVERADFESAIDKHLKHCPQVSESDEQFVSVEIWEPSITSSSGQSGRALNGDFNTDLLESQTEDLVGWDGILNAERYVRRFGAILWATRRRQIGSNETFQEFVQRSV